MLLRSMRQSHRGQKTGEQDKRAGEDHRTGGRIKCQCRSGRQVEGHALGRRWHAVQQLTGGPREERAEGRGDAVFDQETSLRGRWD